MYVKFLSDASAATLTLQNFRASPAAFFHASAATLTLQNFRASPAAFFPQLPVIT
jgi:hypothetical protein